VLLAQLMPAAGWAACTAYNRLASQSSLAPAAASQASLRLVEANRQHRLPAGHCVKSGHSWVLDAHRRNHQCRSPALSLPIGDHWS